VGPHLKKKKKLQVGSTKEDLFYKVLKIDFEDKN
jgi:hypothetical protein